MKNFIKIFLILILVFTFSACSKNEPKKIVYSSTEVEKADKLEIIDFHSTYQCYSCIYIGDMTLDILERNFAKEMESDKISFQKINVDETKNKEIASRYKARGSSLFFNSIINGKDNIKEDVAVWRLVGKDKEFEDYLVNKIRKIIK